MVVLLVTTALAGYGDPIDGHPSYHEREVHLWTNAVRAEPEAFESAFQAGGCSFYTDFPEASKQARAPYRWHFGLNEVARIHSEDMRDNGFFSHDSSDGTPFAQRVSRFYSSSYIGENIASRLPAKAHDIPPWEDYGRDPPDPALISQDLSSIKHIMWNYVGLIRTTPRLARAIRELRALETEIEGFYRVSRITDGLIGLRNAVRTATIVTMAAWENKTSVGCHYRE